jgi:hypothetical protein
MKSLYIKLTFVVFLAFSLCLSNQLMAQPLPPQGHGSTGDQADGAPLDGGISLLLLLSAAYGGKRIHQFRKDKKNDQ